MKVLIVLEKYLNNTSTLGAPYYNLVRSFESAFNNDDNYEFILRNISEDDIYSSAELTKVLLDTEYDIAIVSPGFDIPVNVEINTAKLIGKKLFICVWDTHCPTTSNSYVNFRLFLKSNKKSGVYRYDHTCLEYSEYCNLLIFDYGYSEIFPNIYCVAVPQDSRILYPLAESFKEYEISFNGTVYTKDRFFYLEGLKKHNIPVNITGDRLNTSLEQWAENHRKSKISLCFNESLFGRQRKGRIFEIASCGNFAIVNQPEVYNFHNGKWFTENIHYVAINKNNYVDIVQYYLSNPDERIKIANQLHSFYLENYSEKHWWNNIFKYSKDK